MPQERRIVVPCGYVKNKQRGYLSKMFLRQGLEGIGYSLRGHLGGFLGIGSHCLTGVVRDIIDTDLKEEFVRSNPECLAQLFYYLYRRGLLGDLKFSQVCGRYVHSFGKFKLGQGQVVAVGLYVGGKDRGNVELPFHPKMMRLVAYMINKPWTLLMDTHTAYDGHRQTAQGSHLDTLAV